MRRTIVTVIAAIVGATFATRAEAQQAQVQTGGVLANGPAASTVATPIAAKVEDDSPDHERFVGHFAVGYFGISQIPIAGATAATPGAGGPAGFTGLGTAGQSVTAPIIGVRYWLQRSLGIDAGVGFGYTSGSTTVNNGGTSTTVSNPSTFGFALHGGLPIAFAEGHHYVFELVPEATLGFATGTVKGEPGAGGGAGGPDTGINGVRLDLGGRIGTEIHFGFIGVPELALQASVGVYFRYQSVSASIGNNSDSANAVSFATSVGSDPWAIFVDNISALYYF
jgi:hypothetical protein